MCMCMYVMYVRNAMHTCMHVCMHVCIKACMYVCMYEYMYVCMYAMYVMYVNKRAWTGGSIALRSFMCFRFVRRDT